MIDWNARDGKPIEVPALVDGNETGECDDTPHREFFYRYVGISDIPVGSSTVAFNPQNYAVIHSGSVAGILHGAETFAPVYFPLFRI